MRFCPSRLTSLSMCLTDESVENKLEPIISGCLITQTVTSLLHAPGWQSQYAILCLAIDILEYVLNWRERRGQTRASHKRISWYTDYREFITYTRMKITTSDFVPCDWHLGACVYLTRASRTNYSESGVCNLLHRLSWVYYIHQDDNRKVHNRMCKRTLKSFPLWPRLIWCIPTCLAVVAFITSRTFTCVRIYTINTMSTI